MNGILLNSVVPAAAHRIVFNYTFEIVKVLAGIEGGQNKEEKSFDFNGQEHYFWL